MTFILNKGEKMTENFEIALMIFLSIGAGFVFSKIFEKEKKPLPEKKTETEEREVFLGKDPMELRNGYKVTRDKNPTFAEQWVNIMNFSGESQTEVEYEETEDHYPERNLG